MSLQCNYKLQNLLASNPEERLILPAKYHLYKIYSDLNLNGEAEIAKSDIVTNYPDSRYAELLLNPKSVFTHIAPIGSSSSV